MRKWLIDWVDNFLNREYSISQNSLGIYRICYSSFFLIFGVPSYSWIAKNPDIFFKPPRFSFSSLFSEFPPFEFFIILDLAIIVLFVFLLFGYKTKTTSICITLLLIVGNSFKYSFGKIDHDIIQILVPFLMSFSGWGATFSIDAQKQQSSTTLDNTDTSSLPLTLIALVIGIGFFSAGMPKLFSWMDFDLTTQGTRNWVLRGYYVLGRDDFLLPSLTKISNPFFWELLDYSAIAFEVCFIFSVIKRKYFQIFVCLAIVFHTVNLLIVNIGFTKLLIVYLLFIDWNIITDKINIQTIKEFINFKNFAITLLFYLFLTLLIAMDTNELWTTISPIGYILNFFWEDFSKYIQLTILSLALVMMCYILKYRLFKSQNF